MALVREVEAPDGRGAPFPVVAIDRFEHVEDPASADPFSRAVVEFKAGTDAHRDRFLAGIGELLEGGVLGAVAPGIATVFPGHEAGSLHGPLVEVTAASVAATELGYDQVLRRTETVTRQRDRPRDERWAAMPAVRASLAARGTFDGQGALLVDDVVVTGASLAAGARLLRERGADPVVGLALGMTDGPGVRRVDPGNELGAVLKP